jgi:hypothetical protein
MKRTAFVLGALGALTILSGCGGGYGYREAAFNGPDDVWYDGSYGAYSDGYWGPDAAFYYRGGDGAFIRDTGGHFRHERFSGARGYHARHHD